MSQVHLGRAVFALALAVFLMAGPMATAQDKAAGGYKIGVVDRSKLFEGYDKQKEKMSTLEKDAKDKEEELQKDIDAFEAYVKQQQDREKAGSLSSEQILDVQEEFNRRENELKSKRAEWQRELDIKTQRIMSELRIDIDKAIKAVGARDNYHLILEADSDPRARSAVVYFASPIDITATVLSELNGSRGDDD